MSSMQMEMVAMGYLVYDLTGSPFLLGFVEACYAMPMLALALFGGAIDDRVERKRLIQGGQAAAAVVAIFIAAFIFTDAITWMHLVGAALVEGTLFAFMMPARQAIVPQLVGREKLTNAKALNSAAMGGMTLIAPSIAGGLYAWIGPDGVFAVIAGFSTAAFVVTGMIKRTSREGPATRGSMVSDIKAGLRYVRGSSLVLTLLATSFVTALLSWPFRALMPVFVVDVYGRGPESMGLLMSVLGLGSLIGALFIASLGARKRGLLLVVGIFITGTGLLLVALIPVYFAAAAIMVLLGLGDSGRRTINQTLIMETTEDQFRGRVASVSMMNFGLMPLGVLPAGIAAGIIGGQATIGILAVTLLIFGVIVALTQKRLRSLD